MRFLKPRYDPYPELAALDMRLHREIMDWGKQAVTDGTASCETVKAVSSAARGALESRIIYASMGRDRKKLTPQFVVDAEASARKQMEQAKRWGF